MLQRWNPEARTSGNIKRERTKKNTNKVSPSDWSVNFTLHVNQQSIHKRSFTNGSCFKLSNAHCCTCWIAHCYTLESKHESYNVLCAHSYNHMLTKYFMYVQLNSQILTDARDVVYRKNEAEQCIMMAAKVIAPAIDTSYTTGYNWCIEQVKASQYMELAHSLDIDKAIGFLKQKDFQQVGLSRPLITFCVLCSMAVINCLGEHLESYLTYLRCR